MNELTNHIYVLSNPITAQIRYVGQTNDINQRYRKHLTSKGNTRKHKWVEGLRRKGLKPNIAILESCTKENVNEREIYIIKELKSLGFDLCNHTKGGEGGDTFSGRTHSEETKKKMSQSQKGKLRPDLAIRNKKNLSKRVLQIDFNTKKVINEFESVSQASQLTGCSKTNIAKFANGSIKESIKKVGGFIWEYAN